MSSAELNQVTPTEYRADTVLTFCVGDNVVVAAVVEIQLGEDAHKRRSWPAYVATLHARLGCPVLLLVVCPTAGVATWSATAIPLGHPGFTLTPLVLGPGRIPVVTDPDQAQRSPELTVLSTIVHARRVDDDTQRAGMFEALLVALDNVDQEHGNLYFPA